MMVVLGHQTDRAKFPVIGNMTLTPARWAVGCLVCYFLVALNIVIQNNGGTQGDELPWVWSCWLMLCFLLAGVWFLMPGKKPQQITPTLRWLFVGCIILTLPLIWSPHRDWQYHALPRLAGLWAGLFVYYSLLQCKLTSRQWTVIWTCIAIGALFQAVFIIGEIFAPSLTPVVSQAAAEKFGFGVFQQKNVAASYLATGLALALGMLADKNMNWGRGKLEIIRQVILGLCLIFISAVLYMLYSRTGWICWFTDVFIICSLLFFTSVFKTSHRRRLVILMLPFFGFALGYGLSFLEPSLLKSPHDGSSAQRWLTLKACWDMIIESPLRGWGYGGFEFAFQHWVANQSPVIPTREMMNHPHNEILFWGVEGGITSLIGLVVICIAGIKLIFNRFTPTRLVIGISIIPIMLHVQVEYPLYLSSAHWLIVLLLLISCDTETVSNAGSKQTIKHIVCYRKIFASTIAIFALCGSLFCAIAIHNEVVLTKFEIRKLVDDESITMLPMPWLINERYVKDIALLNILRFQKTNDNQYLNTYIELSHQWLKTRVDADVYNNLINVEFYLNLNLAAKNDQKEAQLLFPYDKRFE